MTEKMMTALSLLLEELTVQSFQTLQSLSHPDICFHRHCHCQITARYSAALTSLLPARHRCWPMLEGQQTVSDGPPALTRSFLLVLTGPSQRPSWTHVHPLDYISQPLRQLGVATRLTSRQQEANGSDGQQPRSHIFLQEGSGCHLGSFLHPTGWKQTWRSGASSHPRGQGYPRPVNNLTEPWAVKWVRKKLEATGLWCLPFSSLASTLTNTIPEMKAHQYKRRGRSKFRNEKLPQDVGN